MAITPGCPGGPAPDHDGGRHEPSGQRDHVGQAAVREVEQQQDGQVQQPVKHAGHGEAGDAADQAGQDDRDRDGRHYEHGEEQQPVAEVLDVPRAPQGSHDERGAHGGVALLQMRLQKRAPAELLTAGTDQLGGDD